MAPPPLREHRQHHERCDAGAHGMNGGAMPGLARSEWYDLTRDMNWTLSYVDQEEAWPQDLSNTYGIPAESWWGWDEPYKITYTEYVHNQVGKDAGVYSVNSVISRSRMFEELDPGWKSAIIAHYGAIAIPEYLAGIGESRMGRFGRAAACRNMATFGCLDETRHGQIQTYFPYTLLGKEPRNGLGAQDPAHQRVGRDRGPAPVRRHVHRQRRGVHRHPAHLHLRDRLHQPAVPRHGRGRDERRRPRLRRADLLHPDRRGPALPARRADDQDPGGERQAGRRAEARRPHVLAQ